MDTVINTLSLIYDQAEYIVANFYLVTLGNNKKLYNAIDNKLYNGYVNNIETKYLGTKGFIVVAIEDRDSTLESEDVYTTYIIYKTGEEKAEAGLFRYNFSANGLDTFMKKLYTGSYSEVLIVRQDDKSTLTHCKVTGIGLMQNDKSCIYLNQKGKNGGQSMVIIDREYNIISLDDYMIRYAKKDDTEIKN